MISLKEKFFIPPTSDVYIYMGKSFIKREEEDFEVQLIENNGETFGLEKSNINETKKIGNERAKISKVSVNRVW